MRQRLSQLIMLPCTMARLARCKLASVARARQLARDRSLPARARSVDASSRAIGRCVRTLTNCSACVTAVTRHAQPHTRDRALYPGTRPAARTAPLATALRARLMRTSRATHAAGRGLSVQLRRHIQRRIGGRDATHTTHGDPAPCATQVRKKQRDGRMCNSAAFLLRVHRGSVEPWSWARCRGREGAGSGRDAKRGR